MSCQVLSLYHDALRAHLLWMKQSALTAQMQEGLKYIAARYLLGERRKRNQFVKVRSASTPRRLELAQQQQRRSGRVHSAWCVSVHIARGGGSSWELVGVGASLSLSLALAAV